MLELCWVKILRSLFDRQRGHISLAHRSHPNSEVKQVRAGVVLRWGTTREGPVLRFFFFIRLRFFLNAFPLLCVFLPEIYLSICLLFLDLGGPLSYK